MDGQFPPGPGGGPADAVLAEGRQPEDVRGRPHVLRQPLRRGQGHACDEDAGGVDVQQRRSSSSADRPPVPVPSGVALCGRSFSSSSVSPASAVETVLCSVGRALATWRGQVAVH